MKRKFSRAKLLSWLQSAANVTLLSISLINNVSSVVTNVSSPSFVAKSMEKRIEAFPKGRYIVEYKYSESNDEQDNIPYTKTILAMAYDANLTSGSKILNLSSLLPKIGDNEYIVTSSKDTGAYKLVSVFVKQPENPLELEKLLKTLNEHATFVSVEDGSGLITGVNSFISGNKFT